MGMNDTLTGRQRLLGVLWLRGKATVHELADDARWGGRMPDYPLISRLIDQLISTGSVYSVEPDLDEQIWAVEDRAAVEAEGCARVLSCDPAVAYTSGGIGGLE